MSDSRSTLIADLDTFSREIDNEWNKTINEINNLISKTRNSIAIKFGNFKKELATNLDKHMDVIEKNNNDLKDLQATEIRCQEQSKGGLKFDVIIADPASTPPAPKRPLSPTRTKSVENIEEKLKAAEERRLSIEASKKETISAKLSKIEEASKKKDEQTTVFINQTKEALDQKMELHTEKRDAYISDIKTKLKEHLASVEKTRQSLEQQTCEVRKELEEKLTHASAQRDENLKNMVERLKKHEEQVKKVRTSNQEKIVQLETQIQSKMDQAKQRRDILEKETIEKLRIQNKTKLEEVKQSSEEEAKKILEIIQEKLETAEKKRLKELERKMESARIYEKKAEMVRQNKKLSINQEEQNTASSG